MRDIPVFTTELGVASLTLNQIPYTQKAYIRIQDSRDGDDFLKECISFCVAAGADYVYATGHRACERYPEETKILKMQADLSCVGDTDTALFPVTEETLEKWRGIYNEKVKIVPNGAFMTMQDAKEMLQAGDGYFIHKNGLLLGIGKASGDQIHWVASVQPGAGSDVVRALCHAVTTDTVCLEVASENHKALALYQDLGFLVTAVISVWYRVK